MTVQAHACMFLHGAGHQRGTAGVFYIYGDAEAGRGKELLKVPSDASLFRATLSLTRSASWEVLHENSRFSPRFSTHQISVQLSSIRIGTGSRYIIGLGFLPTDSPVSSTAVKSGKLLDAPVQQSKVCKVLAPFKTECLGGTFRFRL